VELFGKPLSEVSIDDIETIVRDKIPESRAVDYKLEVHPGTDAGNKEFLKDISAFANTVGGHLIYGVDEKEAIPTGIKGVEVDDFDKLKLRFENLLRTGVDPPIRGVNFHPVDFKGSKKVIVVQVPKSVARPHVVKIKKHFKFYGRNSGGVHMLEVDDLRRAFLASETLATRIRSFRNDRIARIASGQAHMPIQPGAKTVLHLIPESAFELGKNCDLNKNSVSNVKLMGTEYCTGRRYNYDGFISYLMVAQGREASCYTQVFHNGIIEALDVDLLSHGNNEIHLSYLKQEVVQAFDSFISTMSSIDVGFPVWAGMSLLGVKGYKLNLGQNRPSQRLYPIDRDEMIMPEIFIEHSGISGKDMLRASFDLILNACGHEGMAVYEK